MNIFKKIFGINSTASESIEPNNLTIPFSEDINEQLFLDSQAPGEQQKPEGKSNPVALFLKKEYCTEGYRDGYSYHSGDILNAKIKALMSEFRNAVDVQLEAIRSDVQIQKEHRIEIEGLSGRMVKRIDLLIENQLQTIIQLEKEKENSSAEDGLVMKVVNEYREGFMRGLEDYQTEKLLCGNSGMFN